VPWFAQGLTSSSINGSFNSNTFATSAVPVLKMLAVMCALGYGEMPQQFYLIFIRHG
jgi:hypothetical protein